MQRDKSGECRRIAEGGRAETANTERVFETIFQEHWEKTWLAGYRLTGDPDEAEDIALEAFVRLHHNLARGIENPGGWLYRAVTRLGLNNIRARKRREHYERGEPDTEKAAADPASVYEQQLQAENIRQILGRMRQRSAQLLVLRGMDYAYAEIAEILGVKPSSVGTLLARAQKEFDKLWQRKLER